MVRLTRRMSTHGAAGPNLIHSGGMPAGRALSCDVVRDHAAYQCAAHSEKRTQSTLPCGELQAGERSRGTAESARAVLGEDGVCGAAMKWRTRCYRFHSRIANFVTCAIFISVVRHSRASATLAPSLPSAPALGRFSRAATEKEKSTRSEVFSLEGPR